MKSLTKWPANTVVRSTWERIDSYRYSVVTDRNVCDYYESGSSWFNNNAPTQDNFTIYSDAFVEEESST